MHVQKYKYTLAISNGRAVVNSPMLIIIITYNPILWKEMVKYIYAFFQQPGMVFGSKIFYLLNANIIINV